MGGVKGSIKETFLLATFLFCSGATAIDQSHAESFYIKKKDRGSPVFELSGEISASTLSEALRAYDL